jgi:hypothetical protein
MGLPPLNLEVEMEYKDIRKKFVELSGRYDLVNQNWSDNGADFFINAGQRFLDRGSDVAKGFGKNVQPITAGTIIVKSIGLRSVRKVWAGVSADGLVELTKCTLDWLREEYGEQLSSATSGTPAYYVPAAFRPYPDATTTLSWAGYYDIDDLVLDSTHYTYRGIIICPPPDKTYYVSIDGLFYSPELTATVLAGVWTQTKSYWSEVHPDMLLQAAFYALEKFYRNTEGAKDWKSGLDGDILGMDRDEASEEATDINEMEG